MYTMEARMDAGTKSNSGGDAPERRYRMQSNVIIESIIAQEKRRDLLHQAEQHRLIQQAKAERRSGVKADPWTWSKSRIRMMWRKATNQGLS
jgi:hypothetical protein